MCLCVTRKIFISFFPHYSINSKNTLIILYIRIIMFILEICASVPNQPDIRYIRYF